MMPKDHHRVFKNPVLEFFTLMPWYMPAVLFGSLGVAITLHQWQIYPTLWPAAFGQLVFGMVTWTLLEYGLHRYIFHMKPTNRVKHLIEYYTHGIHHAYPSEKYRLVAPPLMSAPIGFVVFGLVYVLTPPNFAFIYMTGIILGYLNYEWTHYSTHHRRALTSWGKYLKKYHMLHHFKHAECMYGVSSPLWDLVFGTYQRV